VSAGCVFIVEGHCNLRLVDRIFEEIGHCEDNIDWSSSDDNSE